MFDYVLDLVAAHRKALLAGAGALLIQIVDSDTADWIVAGLDLLLVALVPNDGPASDRIYRGHRR